MLMVKKIVLSVAAVLFACTALFAQNKQITGTVTGPDGSPVVGATVVVEGTTIGTSTDLQGKYTLEAPANGSLVVSFIGYEDAKLEIAGKTLLNVSLKEASKAIDDIIVVAFGEAKKEAFTGSASVINSDDLAKTQSSNVANALVGKVAGMQTASASGRPGSTPSIMVRGIGSMNAGTEPLWVVDGIPYSGDINNINTADIESISVLKDAASNALYGARGANGVIMVTTKRAKAGDASINFDAKWGVNQRALQTYDYVNDPGEYYELHYRSLYDYYRGNNYDKDAAYQAASALLTSNDPGGLGYNVMTVPAGQNLIGSNGRLNPHATAGRLITNDETGEQFWLQPDDWLDALYKNSFRQEYNINASAAGDKTNFFASFGYLDNNGIVDGSRMERYTARLRADYQAKKWLKIGGNFSYTHFDWQSGENSEGESDGGNVFATAVQTAPIYPIYIRDAHGNHIYDKWGFPLFDTGDGSRLGKDGQRTTGGSSNELQDIQLNKYNSEGNAFSANGFVDIRFYRDLKLTINGGVVIDETRSTTLLNPYYGQFATSGGVVSKSHSRSLDYNLQQLLNYTHTFGTQHNIDILLGHEVYAIKSYSLSGGKSKMFSYDNDELNGLVVDNQQASSSYGSYNNEGFFLRAQYDFDNRVFASASYRLDASSKFHPDHRWGNFWSVSAAWLLNKEKWFDVSWIDMLKVKASYGSQGNDSIGSFLYTDIYQISNDGQGGIATIFAQKGNPDITWETNTNLNVGVEFGFWQSRLSGSVEYFHRKTSDMLFYLPVAPSLGYSGYYTNIGDMLNQGVEIVLNADLIRSKNFVWSFGLNMTHFQNKITRLPDEYKNNTTADGTLIGRQSGSNFLAEGNSIYTWYIPTYAGVNEKGESMWYTYEESNGKVTRTTTTDWNDANQYGRELQGRATPDVYGGFNTAFMFYGVDISANFTYQIGGQAYDSGYASMMGSPMTTSVGFALHRDLWDAWTPENTSSNIPRFYYSDEYTNATSSRFLTDASYLNIQNITVGYTLPQRITRKFLVQSLRVYVVCDNVWYWSQRKGLDPRQSFSGATNPYYYAPVRTISGGVSITF